MNLKARELGCDDTYFITPNGLDAENKNGIHSTTAKDLARILRYCIMESPKKRNFLQLRRCLPIHSGIIVRRRFINAPIIMRFLE